MYNQCVQLYVHSHREKCLACYNVVENRPEQYFAAHIVPGVNNIVQAEQYC
jgi:hypothetical protein